MYMENLEYTQNGACSYASTGKEIVNQFGKAGSYRGRDIQTVWAEQEALWNENKEFAIKFPFYLRLITRKTKVSDKCSLDIVQMGQGARDEAFKRLLWIAKYHSSEFYDNLWLIPIFGSWKDLWVLMSMDDTLIRTKFYKVIYNGLTSSSQKDLVLKYMPRIRSNNKCRTRWSIQMNKFAKEFCTNIGYSFEEYRKFKSSGIAHKFQQVICDRRYDELNWKIIPGKALLNLVSGKFLHNHNLEESYMEWLVKQDTLKFNGYPYELSYSYRKNKSLINAFTVNKQFENLINTVKENHTFNGNVLCALDTSGSMTWGYSVEGIRSGISAEDICLSLGIYFSELNTGDFHNVVAMFSRRSELYTFRGKTFSEKVDEIYKHRVAMGDTNFQSLIDLLVRTRINNPKIDIKDYPSTILVVSDMQFNSCDENKTNIELAREKMLEVFPKEYIDNLKFVWWNCSGRYTYDVPSTLNDKNSFYFSGFDGSIISTIIGEEKKEKGERNVLTMDDIIEKAFSQDIFKFLKI